MRTYTMLDGTVYDLTDLSGAELDFFERAVAAFRSGMRWADFNNTFVSGPENPLLRDTNGALTRSVWNHPLFQCVYDLGDRLGVDQGMVTHDGERRDPLEDEAIGVPEAARRKGVTVPGLHKAIARGAVLSRRAEQGSRSLIVSTNSLARWEPDPVRQSARRGRTSLRA